MFINWSEKFIFFNVLKKVMLSLTEWIFYEYKATFSKKKKSRFRFITESFSTVTLTATFSLLFNRKNIKRALLFFPKKPLQFFPLTNRSNYIRAIHYIRLVDTYIRRQVMTKYKRKRKLNIWTGYGRITTAWAKKFIFTCGIKQNAQKYCW